MAAGESFLFGPPFQFVFRDLGCVAQTIKTFSFLYGDSPDAFYHQSQKTSFTLSMLHSEKPSLTGLIQVKYQTVVQQQGICAYVLLIFDLLWPLFQLDYHLLTLFRQYFSLAYLENYLIKPI